MNPMYPLAFFLGAILIMGAIAGGGVLIWQSYHHSTCGDWSYQSQYYPLWNCGYSSSSLYGIDCNKECYCVSPTFSVDCLDLPSGPSKTMLIWGIILVVGGGLMVLGCGSIAFFMWMR